MQHSENSWFKVIRSFISYQLVINHSIKPRQAIEVLKRQAKARETPGNSENVMKLEAAEAKLQDLKSNMAILGKEAAAAMAAVESQQQRLTLHRLIAMVMEVSFQIYLTLKYIFFTIAWHVCFGIKSETLSLLICHFLRLKQSAPTIKGSFKYLISSKARYAIIFSYH